ncbi:MAG: glucosamine-6-phosphate deaminase [Anaerolineae bacterium]|jgi:glucosamine-6-phosphate deaminase|nr:glucosamine-6-phosphate deaminase [Anaerolineae bacterium]
MVQPRIQQYDQLRVDIYPTNEEMGEAAATYLIEKLHLLLGEKPTANVIFATGNSMLRFYAGLRRHADEVNWRKVRIFHMDEYVGITDQHPASFRRYLHEKIIDFLEPLAFFEVVGDAPDPHKECERYAELLQTFPADICCLGYGENGHLAFNDPPFADFQDPSLVKIVNLAEASRRQQVGEGHFSTLAAVPQQAITLTIPALVNVRFILGIVPERRKAEAVKTALTGAITEDCPGSYLRTLSQARLFLDEESASSLEA